MPAARRVMIWRANLGPAHRARYCRGAGSDHTATGSRPAGNGIPWGRTEDNYIYGRIGVARER
ncbi:MAG: hypothetical protein IPM02_18410 [Betaproteobacteria bacterium]|nr:hypothetical protein [Betaproteobacteria bacterium]